MPPLLQCSCVLRPVGEDEGVAVGLDGAFYLHLRVVGAGCQGFVRFNLRHDRVALVQTERDVALGRCETESSRREAESRTPVSVQS